IIVNLNNFDLWLLVGDRNSLESSCDEEAFNGNSQFYFLEHLKRSPGNIYKLLIQIPTALPPGQVSQSLE
ncbi:hypothetical protein STEG23_033086, partial [Scotinomys teguina]